ncbi:MAG: hypothetical protein AAF495_00380 [Pseudomonadota bacterium]
MHRTLIRLFSALFVAVLLLAGIYYGYLTWQLQPKAPPPQILAAERALAEADTVALLHIDIAAAVRAEQIFLGEADRQALRGPLPGANPVVAKLAAAGVDLRQSLEQLVAGVSLSGRDVTWATILTGRFPVEEIRAVLMQDSLTQVGEGGVLLISSEDLETCEISAPIAVFLSPKQVIFGNPAKVARAIDRLAADAPPDLALAAWRDYRRARLLSLALVVPPMAIGQRLDDPAARFATQSANGTLDPVERLYLGARVGTLPPRLQLDVRLEASGSIWPAQMAEAYEAWRAAFTAQVERRLPALARLQGHATVAADGDSLVVETTLNKGFLNDLTEVPGELLRLAFSGLSADDSATTRPVAEERTLAPTQIATYSTDLRSADLKPFDPTLDQTFKAQTETGPFGLRIKALRLVEPPNPAVQLELEVASSEIANLELDAMHRGESEARAQVYIYQVRDRDGANLLREERCGPDRNSLGGVLEAASKQVYRDEIFVPVSVVEGVKSVRLKPGTLTADIAQVEGMIELRLATRIETLRVSAPFAGKAIERAGVRIKFTEAEPGQVKYDISGKTDRVLAVRAKNQQGAYLAPAGSYATGRLLGAGKTVGRDYQGTPAELEVILASGVSILQYPFTLSYVMPEFNAWDYPKSATVRAGNRAAFAAQAKPPAKDEDCQGSASAGQLAPFWLCLDLQTFWGENVGASGRVLAPASPLLEGNLSALELTVDEVSPAGEEEAWTVAFASFLDLAPHGDQLAGRVNGQVAVPELASLAEPRFDQVAGRVILRLPKRLSRLTLDVSELGNSIRRDDGRAATLIAYDDGGLELEVIGPRDRLVQFIPRDRQGQAMATNNVRVTPGETHDHWLASLRTSGRPATLDVVFAEAQDEQVYDYRLELSE